MENTFQNGKVPHVLSVRAAAQVVGLTPGGLRGAILRGRLRAERDTAGNLLVRSHNLAAFHLLGNDSLYPEEKMRPKTRVVLHDYLETMCGG